MKKLIFILIIFISCEKEEIKPCLNGVFVSDGIELVFDNGILTGQTECNKLNGSYFIQENYINIDLRTTKVFCINEYKTVYFRDVTEYYLIDEVLILKGNDFEIMLLNIN